MVAGVSERRTEEERERPLPRGMRGSCPHSFAPDPRGTAAMVGKLRGKAKRVSRDTREGLSRPAGTEREGSGGDTTRRSVPSRGDHGGGGGGEGESRSEWEKTPRKPKKAKKIKIRIQIQGISAKSIPPPLPSPAGAGCCPAALPGAALPAGSARGRSGAGGRWGGPEEKGVALTGIEIQALSRVFIVP